MSTDLLFQNVDKRKSDKTNLKELRETYQALLRHHESETHKLRKQLLEARNEMPTILQEELQQLRDDAARYKYIRDNHQWRRSGDGPDDHDSHSFVGVKFGYSLDFSCAAMLDHHIDQAIKDE